MKPLQNLTARELERSLAAGEFSGRDKVVAEELLRRHREARIGAIKQKYGWLGPAAAALAALALALRRLLRR